jgi:hypothetical protein
MEAKRKEALRDDFARFWAAFFFGVIAATFVAASYGATIK